VLAWALVMAFVRSMDLVCCGMTTLFIIRHGKAFKQSPTGLDQDRDLRPRGAKQAEWLAETLAAIGRPPRAIVVSKFSRAFHTAKPIAKALKLKLEKASELESGQEPDEAMRLLGRFDLRGPHWPLIIVGHNYQLSDLIGVLIEGPPARRGLVNRPIELRTGQAARLEFDGPIAPGTGTLIETLRMPEDDDDGE
jgi:phosphohistidine phosphatase SixA